LSKIAGMAGAEVGMKRRMIPLAVGMARVQHLEMKLRVNQSQRGGVSSARFQDTPLVKKVVMLSHLVVCT